MFLFLVSFYYKQTFKLDFMQIVVYSNLLGKL